MPSPSLMCHGMAPASMGEGKPEIPAALRCSFGPAGHGCYGWGKILTVRFPKIIIIIIIKEVIFKNLKINIYLILSTKLLMWELKAVQLQFSRVSSWVWLRQPHPSSHPAAALSCQGLGRCTSSATSKLYWCHIWRWARLTSKVQDVSS